MIDCFKKREVKDYGLSYNKTKSKKDFFIQTPDESPKGFVGIEYERFFLNYPTSIRRTLDKLRQVETVLKTIEEFYNGDTFCFAKLTPEEFNLLNSTTSPYTFNQFKTKRGLSLSYPYTTISSSPAFINTFESPGLKDNLSISSKLQNILAETLIKCSPMIYERPHNDGGGIESCIKPVTLKALQKLKPEFDLIINTYSLLGFGGDRGGDGIHLYIDHTLFGKTEEEQKNSILRMIWFLYQNAEIMIDFCGRQENYQYYSDMYDMLGDPYCFLDDSLLLNAFKKQKTEIITAFNSKQYKRVFNISFNRDGRPAIEFRWFGSTSDLNKFMAYAEFGFAMAEFSQQMRDESDMIMSKFCSFVTSNVTTYPHLFNYLNEFKSIKSYLNLTEYKTPPIEQVTPNLISLEDLKNKTSSIPVAEEVEYSSVSY